MKRDFNLWTLVLRPWTLRLSPSTIHYPLSSFLLLFVTASTFAFTSENNNPYTGIVERNVFGIKAPPPPPVATPPPTAATGVELRGITTLLGRPQVLLNFKIPGKPPEPAKDRSMVMDIGQREGEVEVLEINPATGTVRIRNQGNELALNLKDNAPKPQGIAGLAAPVMPAPAGVNPGMPQPGGVPPPPPVAGGTSVSTMGGGGAALPTRTLRANTPAASSGMAAPAYGSAGSVGTTTGQTQKPVRELTAEEGAALLEINRAHAASQGKNLPFPPPRPGVGQ